MLFIQALSFALGAAALSVTAPAKGNSVAQSGNLDITWATVSTDTQSFNIQLALSTDSGNSQTLTSNVTPSTNGYSTPASAFSPGNYTVNLVGNTATSSGVLAQSGWFLITASAVSSSASVTSAAGASTIGAAAASAIASTASQSGAAAVSGAATSAGASGSAASGSAAAASSSSVLTSASSGDKIVASLASFMIAGFAVLMI